MEKMTKKEMIDFLRGFKRKKALLAEDKEKIVKSVETLEEAIRRNTFSRNADATGITSPGFSTDKVLRILIRAANDVEEETEDMIRMMGVILGQEDELNYVESCIAKVQRDKQFLIREVYLNENVIDNLTVRLNRCRTSLYKDLQIGMDQLLDIYNSHCEEMHYIREEKLARQLAPYFTDRRLAV